MEKKPQTYIRHSVVSLEEGLAAISAFVQNRKKRKAVFNGITVNCNSLRLQTFYHKGLTCVTCGAKATHFAIESNQPEGSVHMGYHINMWGVTPEGEDVLFTHDHILARALGGEDILENTQTMCNPCNYAKSRGEAIEKSRRDKEKKQAECKNAE